MHILLCYSNKGLYLYNQFFQYNFYISYQDINPLLKHYLTICNITQYFYVSRMLKHTKVIFNEYLYLYIQLNSTDHESQQ